MLAAGFPGRKVSESFADIDNGPTKVWMLANRDKVNVRPKFDLTFGKRPAKELYDLRVDPHHMNNVASLPDYNDILNKLHEKLFTVLEERNDPRIIEGADCKFDKYPYAGMPDLDWFNEVGNDRVVPPPIPF